MSPAILGAMVELNARLVHAEVIGEAILDAFDSASANPPAWVHVYRGQVARVLEASEALETLLRGYRGCAPDGDLPDACPIDLRGQFGTLPGTDPRLEKQSFSASE